MLLFFIPSPSQSVLSIGPLHIHAYGVAIAAAVLIAVTMASRRWVARGGTTDDVNSLAVWGVPTGIVGARAYHVITDFELYRHDFWRAFAVWDGGLGIWGGIAAGVLAGLAVGRKRKLPLLELLDMVAPTLAAAQAVGRWGNYFNQELFGRPTTLPWGLRIDLTHRPLGFESFSTFHPTFLYESLWDGALAGLLIIAERRLLFFRLRPGRLFAAYVAGYTLGRFFIERIRIDFAHTFAGLRINEWTSLLFFGCATSFLVFDYFRFQHGPINANPTLIGERQTEADGGSFTRT